MREIRYEMPMSGIDFTIPTVFLAGPTVRGNQPHLKSWRPEAVDLFKKQGFEGNIVIPEFTDPTVSDKHRSDLPVWEFEGLRKSKVIMFWIPRTRELIGLTTNYELGYWTARNRNKVIYGRPDDAYRIDYCDIMWEEDCKRFGQEESFFIQDFSIYNTLEKTVEAVIKIAKV